MSDEPARSALFTDLYELTMASAYFSEDIDDRATFELWIRELPPDRNFLVAAGLQDVVRFLSNLEFDGGDIEYLAGLGLFSSEFLDHLRALRFTGDLWAMPEGTIAFAPEPLLRITARRIEAQLVETFLLTAITFQTLIATKAARVAIACNGRPFADFAARRAHGPDAAMGVARASYIGGASSTSNVAAGRAYGIPVSGTMAHSFVLSFPNELASFRAYTRSFPEGGTLLIDTFDIAQGARNAVVAVQELQERGGHLRAVRIDSGDLASESKKVRSILDEAGFHEVQIVASSDLDEFVIQHLHQAGAPIDAFGVGTRLGTSADQPSLGGVYKLVEDASGGRAKTSAGKATIPFAKQVYRRIEADQMVSDTIAREGESGIAGEPLLRPVIKAGKLVQEPESLESIRDRRASQVAQLPEHLLDLRTSARPYPVCWSPELEPFVQGSHA